jgi:hypothetical protein
MAALYSNISSMEELKQIRERLLAGQQSSGHGAGDFQSRINAVNARMKAIQTPAAAPKPVAAAPAPAPVAAPQPTDNSAFNQQWSQPAPVVADPVAQLAPVQQSVPAAAAAVLASVPPPEVPTLAQAENRVDPPPAAQLDPQATPATPKKKKFGIASTILTGEAGLKNLGSTGTRMLLG